MNECVKNILLTTPLAVVSVNICIIQIKKKKN